MHPLTDALPDYLDALSLRQACGEIEERLTRERDEFQRMAGANGLAALEAARERDEARADMNCHIDHLWGVISKKDLERDALRAELAVSEKSSAQYMAERNQARDLVRAKNAEIDALRAEVERLRGALSLYRFDKDITGQYGAEAALQEPTP